MYRTVVTICTASLTFNNSTFCPHSVFVCFVWIWEQTANISLYNNNWLIFVTETASVYCAVRTGYFSHGQLPKERYAGFNLEANPHEIWGGKCGTVMDLCRMTKVFCGLPQLLEETPPVPYSRTYPTQIIINWSCYRLLYNLSYLKHC